MLQNPFQGGDCRQRERGMPFTQPTPTDIAIVDKMGKVVKTTLPIYFANRIAQSGPGADTGGLTD
jgi:hypothetical protein